MKKTVLIVGVLIGLMGYGTSAQAQMISITGTSATVDPSTQPSVDLGISLTTSGPPPTNLVSVNLLLETANANTSYFTVQFAAGSASFPTANNPAVSTFNTASSSHSGFTDSDPGTDLGANIGAQTAVDNTNGVTSLPVDTLTFTIDPGTPNGTYFFNATLNFATDSNGSFIEGTDNTPVGVTDAPQFSITVVPEPATCSLLAFGVLGGIGLKVSRRNRRKN